MFLAQHWPIAFDGCDQSTGSHQTVEDFRIERESLGWENFGGSYTRNQKPKKQKEGESETNEIITDKGERDEKL